MTPNGTTARQLLSSWPPALARTLEGKDIHGGPPVVHVPGHLLASLAASESGGGPLRTVKSGGGGGERSGGGGGYHLGVLHYFKTNSSVGPKGRKRDVKVSCCAVCACVWVLFDPAGALCMHTLQLAY